MTRKSLPIVSYSSFVMAVASDKSLGPKPPTGDFAPLPPLTRGAIKDYTLSTILQLKSDPKREEPTSANPDVKPTAARKFATA